MIALTLPVITTTRVAAQTLEVGGTGPSEIRAQNFVADHVAAIAVGASLVAAGLGAGFWLWRRRGLPNDGIERTPSQLRAYRQLMDIEKILTAEERAPRRAAVANLLNLIPGLAPADRTRAFHRLAQHFCLDWKWLLDDKTVEHVMRGKVSRWSKDWRAELSRKLAERLEDPQEAVRKNAAAAHKWFQQK